MRVTQYANLGDTRSYHAYNLNLGGGQRMRVMRVTGAILGWGPGPRHRAPGGGQGGNNPLKLCGIYRFQSLYQRFDV